MAGDAKDIIMKNRDVRIQIPTMADREGPEGPLLYVFEGPFSRTTICDTRVSQVA